MKTTPIALPVLLLLLLGCGGDAKPLGLALDAPSPLAGLEVECLAGSDLGGGNSLRLRLHNPSDTQFDEVRISINERYFVRLEDLIVHRGFIEGSEALGRSSLAPGDDETFVFSHDVSNQTVTRTEDGKGMPLSIEVQSIRIDSAQGTGIWRRR